MTQIEVTVAAPVDAVWDALRDREKVRRWHGWDYPGLDDEVDQFYFTDVVEDGHTLSLGGGDRFAVSPSGTGAVITLTRPPRDGHPEADAYYDDITEGWTTFLHQLRFFLERQPGAVRRTLYFAGAGHDLTAELGIADAGPRYTADLAGEQASGELWFRSADQIGVTVDSWGEGLLVVTHTGMAVLSTYGLDEAAFADLDARWSGWWSTRTAD